MSGLSSFFEVGDSYETSLMDVVDPTRDADNDQQQEASAPESQQQKDEYQQHKLDLKTKTMNYLRHRIYGYATHPGIPHVGKALLDVNEIAKLSLNVRTLNLSLCEMQKYWPLRSCNRGQNYQNVKYTNLQRDGPISSLYRSVLSFEVLQCFEKPPSELSQRIRNLHGQNHLHHVCRVFLYHSYAHKMTELLTTHRQAGHRLYCSLRHVPAQCIHRYKAFDWADAKEAYCLTIGGDSKATVGDRSTRFDSEDLIIEIIRVDKNDKLISEYQMRRLDDGTVVLEKIEESRLLSIYRAYKAKGAKSTTNADQRAPDERNPPDNQEGEATTVEENQQLGPRCVKLVSVLVFEMKALTFHNRETC